MVQTTVQDLFQQTKSEWLDEARATARRLLVGKTYITINDVLEHSPRPEYIHRNTTGQVFRHPDFKVYGFQKSVSPLARGRIICQWTLKEDLPRSKYHYWNREREAV